MSNGAAPHDRSTPAALCGRSSLDSKWESGRIMRSALCINGVTASYTMCFIHLEISKLFIQAGDYLAAGLVVDLESLARLILWLPWQSVHTGGLTVSFRSSQRATTFSGAASCSE